MGVGDVVDELGGHERLEEADDGHREGRGGDDAQGVELEGDLWQTEGGETVGQTAAIGDGRHTDSEGDDERGERHDDDERCGHGIGESGEADEHRDGCGGQRVDSPGHVGEFGDLCEEDQDRQSVDEADHHAARHEPHHLCRPGEAEGDLDQAGEDDGRDEVVETVALDDRGDDEGDGPGGGRDHRRSTAGDRDRDGHGERCEEPDPGVDPGEDGERDRLGDEGQCDDEAGEQFDPEAPPLTQHDQQRRGWVGGDEWGSGHLEAPGVAVCAAGGRSVQVYLYVREEYGGGATRERTSNTPSRVSIKTGRRFRPTRASRRRNSLPRGR